MNSKRLGINFRVFFDIIKTMIKIAFFDIDGTLFDNAKQIWKKKTMEGIKQIQKRGIKCVLCTSRPYHSMEKLGAFDQGIKFDGWIGSCGAVASYNGKIIQRFSLNPELVKKFIEKCGKDGYTMEVVGIYERTLIYPQTKESLKFYDYYKESIPPLKPYDGNEAITMNFFAPSSVRDEYSKEFPTLIINEYIPNCFDIMEHMHRKSEGMKAVLDELGYSKDEAIAFGDDIPDIEMLKAASTFVCMGQGKEEVKKIASFVSKPVSEDGVYHGLKHYGLLGEGYE